MGLVLASTAGLCLWVTMWSLGAKGIDAFMITTLIVLVGIMSRMLAAYLPNRT